MEKLDRIKTETDVEEFALAPQPRSMAALLLALLLLLPLASVVLSGFLSGPLPRPAAVAVGVAIALLLVVTLLWNQQAQPAGVLRLESGRLLFTAGVGPAVLVAPSQVRDCVVVEGHVLIHRRGGPRIVINPARLTVPAERLMAAVQAWMARGGDVAAFDEASRQAAARAARRQRLVLTARVLAVACALAAAAMKQLVR
jgi:hypothetical protein